MAAVGVLGMKRETSDFKRSCKEIDEAGQAFENVLMFCMLVAAFSVAFLVLIVAVFLFAQSA